MCVCVYVRCIWRVECILMVVSVLSRACLYVCMCARVYPCMCLGLLECVVIVVDVLRRACLPVGVRVFMPACVMYLAS